VKSKGLGVDFKKDLQTLLFTGIIEAGKNESRKGILLFLSKLDLSLAKT
jgi:hypothetical protein